MFFHNWETIKMKKKKIMKINEKEKQMRFLWI